MATSPNAHIVARGNRGQHPSYDLSRDELRKIALHTLDVFREGSYFPPGSDDPYDLDEKIRYTTQNTLYFSPEDPRIVNWKEKPNPPESTPQRPVPEVVIGEFSCLVGIRKFYDAINKKNFKDKRVGALCFASGVKPAGGFINGAQAQEESLARSSTLRESLVLPKCKPFYQYWTRDRNPYYSHSIIYAPNVVFFKNERGFWRSPMEINIVTAAAVNAKEVRDAVRAQDDDMDDDEEPPTPAVEAPSHKIDGEDPLEVAEKNIEVEMFERMGRILRVFEMHGIRHIVLGSFGTGVCQNRIDLITGHWKSLLIGDNARFRDSFDTVLLPTFGGHMMDVWQDTFGSSASKLPEEDQSDDEGPPPHRAPDGGPDNDLL